MELASNEEVEEPRAVSVPELGSLAVEVGPKIEPPKEKAVFPANPCDSGDVDEPGSVDELCATDAIPVAADEAWAIGADPLPAPKREPWNWLAALEMAADVPANKVLLMLPKPLSSVFLPPNDSLFLPSKDSMGDFTGTGVTTVEAVDDSNLTVGVVENEGA
ncbi:hypothetical protein TB2_040015 [Malus domestica]